VSTNGFNFSGFLPAFSWLNFENQFIGMVINSFLPEDPNFFIYGNRVPDFAHMPAWFNVIKLSAQFLCAFWVTFQIDRRLAFSH
jgi:hypothetical protein